MLREAARPSASHDSAIHDLARLLYAFLMRRDRNQLLHDVHVSHDGLRLWIDIAGVWPSGWAKPSNPLIIQSLEPPDIGL